MTWPTMHSNSSRSRYPAASAVPTRSVDPDSRRWDFPRAIHFWLPACRWTVVSASRSAAMFMNSACGGSGASLWLRYCPWVARWRGFRPLPVLVLDLSGRGGCPSDDGVTPRTGLTSGSPISERPDRSSGIPRRRSARRCRRARDTRRPRDSKRARDQRAPIKMCDLGVCRPSSFESFPNCEKDAELEPESEPRMRNPSRVPGRIQFSKCSAPRTGGFFSVSRAAGWWPTAGVAPGCRGPRPPPLRGLDERGPRALTEGMQSH